MKRIIFIALTFVVISLPLMQPLIAFAEGTYAQIGTADGADGSADALNFSQGRVWTIDQYGKYIWLTEGRNPQEHHWTWSNDLGANWTQGAQNYPALNRGSVAYDSINDVLHVIWTGDDDNDGVIYRRYSITRDGSNNITAIARMDSGTINLQLDVTASRTLSSPVAIWLNDGSADGILIAVWSKHGTGLTEIRSSMRRLSMSDADGIAGNWVALDGTGDTFSTDGPAVAADKVYGSTTGGEMYTTAKIRGGSGARKDDIYIFAAEDVSPNSRVLAYRGIWDSVDKDWSGGFQAPVVMGQVNNGAGGNTLKFQLITKPVLDETNDRLYIGWPRWKAGGEGDTVSFAYLDSTDTASSVTDVYSANGTHSYAPTLDIAFDNTRQELYVSYIESTTNGDNGSINYKVFDGTTLGDAVRFYTSPGGSSGADGGADIPILYEQRTTNDRLLFAYRVNGALPPTGVNPHSINWGYITLAAASTPTPSPTSTPASNTNNSSNNSAPSNNTTDTPSCNDRTPNKTPDLFQVDAAGTFAVLHFTTISDSTQGYEVSFGNTPDANQYTDRFSYNGPKWILDHTISHLQTNSNYYFKVRATNGCTAGDYSKVVQVKTKGRLADLSATLAKYNPFSKPVTPSYSPSVATGGSCDYVVQDGDSLWKIASDKLGSGSKFNEIIALNTDQLNGKTMIKAGMNLKVCN